MGEIVTSKQNDRIRYMNRLKERSFRQRERRFLVEGIRLVEDCLQVGAVEETWYSARLLDNDRGKALLSLLQEEGIRVTECSDALLGHLADTVNPQGIIAIGRMQEVSYELQRPALVIICDRLQDPGNLGVLFRTAAAAGASGLIIIKGSVDPYNPKVLRASMGGVFRLPHWSMTIDESVEFCHRMGLSIIIADPREAKLYFQADLSRDLALVIGNEANGVHDFLVKNANGRVMIPLTNGVESLNASVSAGILIYEAKRQRVLAFGKTTEQ